MTSALTAVPWFVPEGLDLPPPREMTDWFRVGEDPLRVFSTAPATAQLMIVRDREVDRDLQKLSRAGIPKTLPRFPTTDLTVSFLATRPHRLHEGVYRISDASSTRKVAGLWALLSELHPAPKRGRQRLWTSTAAAGRGAAANDARRAVLLLLSSRSKAHGPLSATQIVGYLASIRVPLFIWAPDNRVAIRHRLPETLPVYVGADGLERLFGDLRDSLATQRVVWLEGEHLPNRVTLGSRAPEGLHLVE